ncbi:hypothetical protein IJG72_06040 [bacterium]|nr:hypothetical protein [bacterium]
MSSIDFEKLVANKINKENVNVETKRTFYIPAMHADVKDSFEKTQKESDSENSKQAETNSGINFGARYKLISHSRAKSPLSGILKGIKKLPIVAGVPISAAFALTSWNKFFANSPTIKKDVSNESIQNISENEHKEENKPKTVIDNLLETVKNLPEDKEKRNETLLKIYSTDLKTGEQIILNDRLQKRLFKNTDKLSNDDLKVILEHELRFAAISNESSLYPDTFPRVELCKLFKEMNAYSQLEQRCQNKEEANYLKYYIDDPQHPIDTWRDLLKRNILTLKVNNGEEFIYFDTAFELIGLDEDNYNKLLSRNIPNIVKSGFCTNWQSLLSLDDDNFNKVLSEKNPNFEKISELYNKLKLFIFSDYKFNDDGFNNDAFNKVIARDIISNLLDSKKAPEEVNSIKSLIRELVNIPDSDWEESYNEINQVCNSDVPICDKLSQIKYIKLLGNKYKEKGIDCIDDVKEQKKYVSDNPERYINGVIIAEWYVQFKINSFFDNNYTPMLVIDYIFDKNTLNTLLRMRLDKAEDYCNIIENLNKSDIELLHNLGKSKDINGKPFTPKQKIEFIDLVQAYKDCNVSFDKIQSMIESGKVDIYQLNMDLLKETFKQSGYTDEEIATIPKEKLLSWDLKYIHLLPKEINENKYNTSFKDIIRMANSESDFRQCIHDTNNNYGQTNAITKSMYEEMGMDYEHWLNPLKDNEIQFVAKDKNAEQLSQIGAQLLEDIEALRSSSNWTKKLIDKQFAKNIKSDKFVIPNDILTSKAKLTEFINKLIKQLDKLWNTAQNNINNPEHATSSRNTLTILNHFNQRIADISSTQNDDGSTKTLDLTIKMWDRNPQKDLFQGNYSTCCIGMGGGNGSAMPHYIMDTAYNMIEIVDNESGKPIGNALCYFIKGENGKPAFVIDNIEINNSVKPSNEVGLKLRSSIVEYASKIAKEVTGSDDVPIYMSGSYNDVPCSDLEQTEQQISFLGDIDCDDIYMDLYSGWIDKIELANKKLTLLKLK